jgi:hypothetical protein
VLSPNGVNRVFVISKWKNEINIIIFTIKKQVHGKVAIDYLNFHSIEMIKPWIPKFGRFDKVHKVINKYISTMCNAHNQVKQ